MFFCGWWMGSVKGSGNQLSLVGIETAEGSTPSWWFLLVCLESQRKLNSVKAFTGEEGSVSELQAEWRHWTQNLASTAAPTPF